MQYCTIHNTNNCGQCRTNEQTKALVKSQEDCARSIIETLKMSRPQKPDNTYQMVTVVLLAILVLTQVWPT